MMTGMLWFDNDPKTTLEDKIKKALEYYQKKYEKKTELCLVNPNTAKDVNLEKLSKESDVTVRAFKSAMPHHFWLGNEEKVVKA